MTPAPISGPSASQRSSWHRGGLPDRGNHLARSSPKCKLSHLCYASLIYASPSLTPWPQSGAISSTLSNRFLIAVPRQRGSRATHPRSSRWRAQIFSCIQGNRGTVPRERSFTPVPTIQVSTCLHSVDNVPQRPTAAQLLQTPFFRNTKKPSYLVGTILRMSPFLKSCSLR